MKNKIQIHKRYKLPFAALTIVSAIALSLTACQKYLDAKPNQALATTSTIADLQGLLNNYGFINAIYPSVGEISSDNLYLSTANFNSLAERQRMFYTWQKYDDIGADYDSPYQAIEYANVMLNALPSIVDGDAQSKNIIEGNSLFIRGSFHYALAQIFSKPYMKSSANTDLGIALRLTSDITVKPVRSSVADTYNSILTDLKKSIPLLPAIPNPKNQASKTAAYGLLARIYLSMSDYPNAGLYVDSALQLYNTLIDYNTISPTTTLPFAEFNDEVIYDARGIQEAAILQSRALVDTNLYASYASNDLRLALYFKATAAGHVYKPNYTGQSNASLFAGIATDELYLIKAETEVRNGDSNGGLSTLNTLLSKRFKTGTFVPYNISDPAQLLSIVLQERRKELPLRGLRWTDLRRLNQDPNYATTLYRNVNGITYQLPSGSLRYVLEIDQNAVNLSGLIQNP